LSAIAADSSPIEADLEGFQILSLRRGHARLTIRWLFVCCYGYSQETVQPSKFRTDLAELLSMTFTDNYVCIRSYERGAEDVVLHTLPVAGVNKRPPAALAQPQRRVTLFRLSALNPIASPPRPARLCNA